MDYISWNKFYVYKHYYIDKNGEEVVFYIGKGKKDRMYNQQRNLYWKDIVKSINCVYYVSVIRFFECENEAYAYEKELQAYYWNKG